MSDIDAAIADAIRRVRARAAPVGPMHSGWELIFDAKALLEGKMSRYESKQAALADLTAYLAKWEKPGNVDPASASHNTSIQIGDGTKGYNGEGFTPEERARIYGSVNVPTPFSDPNSLVPIGDTYRIPKARDIARAERANALAVEVREELAMQRTFGQHKVVDVLERMLAFLESKPDP